MSNKYKPLFHISAQKGWINDPNGFSYAFGKYHLFAQHNPYKSEWGPMHWIHFTSTDLVAFNEKGIALKPDTNYDLEFGCFSGSAYFNDKKHYLFYTGVNNGLQQQCVAVSLDGESYHKLVQNPFIKASDLPVGYSGKDFRDPYVIKHEDYYYFLISVKKLTGGSSILTYRSKDLVTNEFVGVTKDTPEELDEMLECPALTFIDGRALLVYSLQFKKEKAKYSHQNIHANIYEIGEFDFKTGVFTQTAPEQEIDLGFDYYAPQLLMHDDKHYLVAWQNMWDRNNPSAKDGYAGHLTMVRKLSIINDKLIQNYMPALPNYYTHSQNFQNEVIKGTYTFDVPNKVNYRAHFVLDVKEDALISFTNNELVNIKIDPKTQTITFNREGFVNNDGTSANSRTIQIAEAFNHLILDIVHDGNAVTVLINDGKYAFSYIYYSTEGRMLKLTSKYTLIKLLSYHALALKEETHV